MSVTKEPLVYTKSGNSAQYQKPSFGMRLKNHLKKWWWVYVIVVIILILVTVLPIIYVGFPHLAQQNINEASLGVDSMAIYDPTPDNFTISLNSVIYTDSSYHPSLDAVNASFYINGTGSNIVPFAYIPIPAIPSVYNGVTSQITNQTVPIANMDQFKAYTALTLSSVMFSVGVKGRLGLKQGGLPHTTVNYDKVVTLKGLDHLDGFNITDTNILSQQPDGTNLNGTVFIPNPSVMTLAMGNLTMDMYVEDTLIGNSTLYDFVLRPGNNTHDLFGTLDQLLVLGLLKSNYTNGYLPLTIKTRSVVYNGLNIPYYEQALQASPLSLDLNAGAALAKIGINITSV